MVPMVSNTMMQVTSFVLSGIACILRVNRFHTFLRFGDDRGGCTGGGTAEGLGTTPTDGGLRSLLMIEN